MKKPIKKIARVPRFFSALIRRAYLPTELPPAFTTQSFADFCAKDYHWLKSQQNVLERTATEYETFTVPRTKSGRRSLAVVHPMAQMNVSLLLTEHREKIKDLVGKNRTTLYRTDDDLDRSVAYMGLDFAKRRELQARAYSECRVILNADISRFFALFIRIPYLGLSSERKKQKIC